MERAVILNRVSTSEQEPELQVGDCRRYCENHGWEILSVFEKHISAFKNEDVWKEEVSWAISQGARHVVVWNMDRYSREPEDVVIERVRLLGLMHDLQIHAVHGDAWSEMLDSVAKLKGMGFIGQAVMEFLEKLVRGLEHQRAHRESQVKSERVRSAVRRKDGDVTRSYKGNRWGRKPLPKQTRDKIIALHEDGKSIREIAAEVRYWENGNPKSVSRGAVHKIVASFHAEKDRVEGVSSNGAISGRSDT